MSKTTSERAYNTVVVTLRLPSRRVIRQAVVAVLFFLSGGAALEVTQTPQEVRAPDQPGHRPALPSPRCSPGSETTRFTDHGQASV
jgi:hypothetical protein